MSDVRFAMPLRRPKLIARRPNPQVSCGLHSRGGSRAAERYRALVQNMGSLSASHIAQAREQIRELVGEIRLVPTADGYLDAVLQGRYDGLMKLAGDATGNNLVAGEGFEPSTFGL